MIVVGCGPAASTEAVRVRAVACPLEFGRERRNEAGPEFIEPTAPLSVLFSNANVELNRQKTKRSPRSHGAIHELNTQITTICAVITTKPATFRRRKLVERDGIGAGRMKTSSDLH